MGVNRRLGRDRPLAISKQATARYESPKNKRGGLVFIVQGKPREPAGIVKVVKETRADALTAAQEFQEQGFPFVTIVADGRVYTTVEFAVTILDPRE
jgi:hypothetical protein